MLIRYPERFRALKPQSIEMRPLTSLVEERRHLVNDKIRITNRLRSTLKHYYPQILDWFEHIDTYIFCDFVKRWPTQCQAQRARQATLIHFSHTHNMRFKNVLERRLMAIKTSTPFTYDDAVIIPNRMMA